MRETTPFVMLKVSPPIGKPYTSTSCWVSGSSPNSSGSTPSKKAGSSTASSARSASWATARTRAT